MHAVGAEYTSVRIITKALSVTVRLSNFFGRGGWSGLAAILSATLDGDAVVGAMGVLVGVPDGVFGSLRWCAD